MKLYLPLNWKQYVAATVVVLGTTLARAQDSDPTNSLPLVMVVAPDATALEGTSSGAFTLIRSGPTTAALAVNVQLSGTASNGVDYASISNVITIPAGSIATDVQVSPIVDTANRGNKTVLLSVQTNANYRVGEHRWAAVKIIEDVFDLAPPVVTLSSPTNNSSFTNPPSITLLANATDPDATIRSVSFYADDDFLGKATNSPYSLVWSNPPSGHFSLFARAVDQFNRSALSSPVHITVTQVRPTVTITSPTNGASFAVHQNITVSAKASDPDGTDTIASVRFYANDHLLGTITNSPFSLIWSNAPGGGFALRAVATDSSGVKGYSHPVFIKVLPTGDKRFSK